MLQVIAGLFVTMLLGFGVAPLLGYAGKSMPLLPPSGANEKQTEQWRELTSEDEGGAILGWLERIMFFGAFFASAPVAVAAWLAFKVASKWQAWATIVSVPNKIDGLDEINFLIARRRWGSHLLMTFLIGTAYNILAGLIGAAVALHGVPIPGHFGF